MPNSIITILITVSSILTIVSALPYVINVLKRKTKPRIVSWFIWGVLTGGSCVAAFSEGQYATGIMLTFSSLASFVIVLLGWKLGDKKFERLDVVCLIGAVIGIILWRLLDSPSIAVLVMILTDFIGGIPTIVHCWRKPFEETWPTFMMGCIGSICTLLALSNWQITSFAFPLFIASNSLTSTIIILTRRYYLSKKRR